ncbi:MAG TPA: magnesium-translocating P-type ATPase [Gemmatimonadaceae bacterium]|nr:magnesium-translocating P-type ATPase [Gemmatimonadaceae bacterium]
MSFNGLSDVDARRRLAAEGPNVATRRKRRGAVRLFVAQFASPITLLLLGAAVLSIALGEQTDGGIILGILLVSGALGFWQEYRATDAINRLLALVRTTTTVIRDGVAREIPVEDVVVGDLVELAAGASVPGDARLVECKDLYVDQSALTGESYPAEKSLSPPLPAVALAQQPSMVCMGTHVVTGSARAIVERTGAATEFGAIADRLALRPPITEFEIGIRHFGFLLLQLTATLVIVIFAINVALHRPVLDALLFTLALAVGLTPQLLPAIVSVTLAQGARRMAEHRVIVKRLGSIEDLGGMQVLCTDKTGTITEGVVAVHSCVDRRGVASARGLLLARVSATLESGFPNPIDAALRASTGPSVSSYRKFDEVPYDFVRKRLSVAVTDADGRHSIITKGAFSDVLGVCEFAEDATGDVQPMAGVRAELEQQFESLSLAGYRCLAVAYRELADERPVDRSAERGLTFVGILALSDPLKSGVAETLARLRRLGIGVKLVTGDNRFVAARVAAQSGLDVKTLRTGSEVRHLSEAALVSVAPRIDVFAEIEPQQKERIIVALKKSGLAVGYLGDGINDASALHAADVGISVDSATDVTKEAADIVLLEKDLRALERGVQEGRRAFANTLKYIFITTSANFGNMFSMAGASLFSAFLPLLPKQILLVNVLSDVPAMAISADHLDPELVARPRRWDNRSIRRFMLAFGLVSSGFDFLTFVALVIIGVGAPVFRTVWFSESVLSEILILLVIRTRRPFFRSRVGRLLLWLSVAVGAVTLLLPYTPAAAPLGFAPLTPALLGLLLAIVTLYVVVSEISKRAIVSRAMF